MEANLRLILLGVGVLILAGILLDGWRRKYIVQKNMNHFDAKRRVRERYDFNDFSTVIMSEPKLDLSEELANMSMQSQLQSGFGSTNFAGMIVLGVYAREGQYFTGETLLDVFQAAHLYHGDKNIFHYFEKPDAGGKVLFSVASACKPGYFDLEILPAYQTIDW